MEGTFLCESHSRVRAIHVWELFTCGSYSRVESHSRVEGTFPCESHSRVRAIHVWELFTCGGDIPV